MQNQAEVYLRFVRAGAGRRKFQWSWEIVKCPFCGEKHSHGGGIVGEDDPLEMLGHRIAHCNRNAPDEGYSLTYTGTLPPYNVFGNKRLSYRRSYPKDVRQWIQDNEERVRRFQQGAPWRECFDWG